MLFLLRKRMDPSGEMVNQIVERMMESRSRKTLTVAAELL